MRQSRKSLIDELVADLATVERPGRIGRSVTAWLAISTVYSLIIVMVTGPMREGALLDLIHWPLFAGETLLAVCAIVASAYATLRSAIPGASSRARVVGLALVTLAAWVAVYVAGLWFPVHPVSTLGARSHCIWQVVIYSLPPLGLALYLARRQYPLWPRTTAMLAGAAAAAIPGALMQFGCMYVPSHILTHHMSPILITATIGALAGPFAMRGASAVRRREDVSIH